MEQGKLNGEEYAYLSDLVCKELDLIGVSEGTLTREATDNRKAFLKNLEKKLETKHDNLQK